LFDDGVSADLWKANPSILAHHPSARPWIVSEDLRVHRPWWRLPTFSFLDPLATRLNKFLISSKLKAMCNRDTRVIINAHTLKFHADDGRELFRSRAEETFKKYAP